jgi:hypothetical protein
VVEVLGSQVLDPRKYYVVTFALFCNGEVSDHLHRLRVPVLICGPKSSSPSNTVNEFVPMAVTNDVYGRKIASAI